MRPTKAEYVDGVSSSGLTKRSGRELGSFGDARVESTLLNCVVPDTIESLNILTKLSQLYGHVSNGENRVAPLIEPGSGSEVF
jgi:hypothetical protein